MFYRVLVTSCFGIANYIVLAVHPPTFTFRQRCDVGFKLRSFGVAELIGHTKRYGKINIGEKVRLRRCAGPGTAPGNKVISNQAGSTVISRGNIPEIDITPVDKAGVDCRPVIRGARCPHR